MSVTPQWDEQIAALSHRRPGPGATWRSPSGNGLSRMRPAIRGASLRQVLALTGGVGLLVILSGTAFAESSYESPIITTLRASFTVPTQSTSTWTLQLWSSGSLEGSDTARSGLLAVDVPHVTGCVFQADVDVTPLGGHRYFYSGSRATLRTCGVKRTTQTLAGHIYVCSASGAATTTEIAGGTLAATGPQTVATQANPLVPTAVVTGPYTMTATSPGGYLFVACGGRATVGSGGTAATESVMAPPGGAGVGLFYVAAAPLGAGGGSTGANPVAPAKPAGGGSNNPTAAPAPVHAATAAAHSPPRPVPVTAAEASGLAFTGMDVGPLLLLGLLLIGVGTVILTGPRRSWKRYPVPAVPPKSSS